MSPTDKQLRLPFKPPKESKVERCQRLLSGRLGHKLKPASELQFNYQAATRIARRANMHHRRTPQ